MEEKSTNRVEIDYIGTKRYVGTNETKDRIFIDGNEGVSLGMRPMEALLVSLGTCSAFDVVEILEKRRTPPESYRIELEGERADEYPRRYTRIRVRHIVRGEGIDERQLRRAVALSHEKYCSVHASLNAEIEFEAVLSN